MKAAKRAEKKVKKATKKKEEDTAKLKEAKEHSDGSSAQPPAASHPWRPAV